MNNTKTHGHPLTADQAAQIQAHLYSLEGLLLSLKAFAPHIEADVDTHPDAPLRHGVAWDQVVKAIAERGVSVVYDALEIIVEDAPKVDRKEKLRADVAAILGSQEEADEILAAVERVLAEDGGKEGPKQ